MQAILKVLSVFIGFFVIANGLYIFFMPPFGDEPLGYGMIAVGIIIPILTFYVGRNDDLSEV